MVKLLADLNVGAFDKQALLNKTVNLGADFRDAIRRRASGQFGGQQHLLPGHCHRRDFRRGRRRSLNLARAGGQPESAAEGHHGHSQLNKVGRSCLEFDFHKFKEVST